MISSILDFLFPPVCGICGKLNINWICEKCEKEIKKHQKEILINCRDKYFDKLLYIFKYEKTIRKTILRYKFNDKAYLSKFFSEIIVKNEKICRILRLYDIIIPVPINAKKKKKRGYNQTELIVEEISKKLNLRFDSDNLEKIKETKTQSELNEEQRMDNIKNAFFVNNRLEGKKVILFDDIYTTGATANECSKVLKKAGVKEILVFVLARD